MTFFRFIKNILKHIFPPPVKSFMREIGFLKGDHAELMSAANRLSGELRQQFEQQAKQTDARVKALEEQLAAQNERLDRLSALFESANRENLRIFLDARAERDEMGARYDGLTAQLTDLWQETASNATGLKKLIDKSENIYKAIPNKPVYWHNELERVVVRENWGSVTERPDFEEKYLRLISGFDVESVRIITRVIARQKQYLETESRTLDLFTREEQERMRLLQENFNREIFRVSDDVYAYRNYLLPGNHFESSVFYYRHGIDELQTANWVKGKAILDVGGFIGDSILVLSELQPSVIHSFEADPENYRLMQKTIELNKIRNAVPVLTALGDHEGTCVMHRGGSASGIIYREGIGYTEDFDADMTTLDAYIAAHPMEIGLIKVDIEGAEPFFLEGAKKTICEQRPILLLSIYHNAHDFFELKPLLESWNLGYSFRIHKPTFESTTGETLLIAEIPERKSARKANKE